MRPRGRLPSDPATRRADYSDSCGNRAGPAGAQRSGSTRRNANRGGTTMKGSGARPVRWILLAALAVVACASPPLYEPTLSSLEIPVDRGAHLGLLVSLRAVPADRARGLPAGMEARVRI